MIGHTLKALIGSALVFAAFIFAWRWGEELWYGRYPVEEGYAAYWAADHRRAHPILRAYARQGDPRAQIYVSLQYKDGKGTFRSEWLAARWMRRAAEQDYPDALVLLGSYYVNGTGVAEDKRTARNYYRKATNLGHPEGIAGLASLEIYSGLEHLGLPLLNEAIAKGSIWARAIECHRQIRWPHDSRLPESDRETLRFCVEAGLGGYKRSLSRALIMLNNEESPHRDLERAYELVIIGLAWWPEEWENLDGLVTVYARGSVLVDPGSSRLATVDDLPDELQMQWAQGYLTALNGLHYRIRAIGADPTAEFDPPDFGPYVEVRQDPAAMLRAETAARAFLIDNPRPPSWIR